MTFPRKDLCSGKIIIAPLLGGILVTAAVTFIYLLDQISKHIVLLKMNEGESYSLVNGIFHLTFVHNTGGAFGIMKGYPHIFTAAAILFTLLALIYIYFRWFLIPLRDKLAICLIIGGTLGNLADRVKLGYVIDFLDFRIWPVFNLADSFITVGAGLLIFSLLLPARSRGKCA